MRFDTSKSNEENAQLLLYAQSKGINYFDTAPGYCNDMSEDIFGMALKQMSESRSSYYVSDFSLAELQSLDAGSWFAGAANAGPDLCEAELARYGSGSVRLPSLEQVLALVSSLDLLVNVELKTLPRMYAGLTAAVLVCLERFALRERVLISSTWPRVKHAGQALIFLGLPVEVKPSASTQSNKGTFSRQRGH